MQQFLLFFCRDAMLDLILILVLGVLKFSENILINSAFAFPSTGVILDELRDHHLLVHFVH